MTTTKQTKPESAGERIARRTAKLTRTNVRAEYKAWGHFPAWHIYANDVISTPIAVVADSTGGDPQYRDAEGRSAYQAALVKHIVSLWNENARRQRGNRRKETEVAA